ncbi:transmembrane amino acid transporter protein-domain-containing protein [Halteromyces radiatus]|uniref:transmembrane amino acid transporter protein-domain-containing protein n=1 Tax=Halteromyces radiatus TaxID=101107 RepID=UPI00221E8646|nr:transmembrane amino acid transporter protein-domain-containing protein [Halteromyces radiatus]KAI8097708.1 transmembrane amino acid transporter protein-domain-containing protein [Halteromyces radiatus]
MSMQEKKEAVSSYQGSIVEDSYSSYDGDQFEDVDRSQAGSSFWAYFNVVCVIAGTGTLGLPAALKQGGWFGLFILFLAWFMSTYTAIILIKCLYASGNKRMHTYKDVATAAYGVVGGWVSFFFSAWITLGAPILYMVLSGANLNQLCKGTVAELGDMKWTIISCGIVAIPFVLVKNMKEVAFMSAFGAVATAIVVIIVLVVACIDQQHFTPEQNALHYHMPVIWNQFPIALATISFSFGGNIVYPHVEASMKKPRDWNKVVAFGLGTCAALYFLTAIPGYYIFGNDVASPVYNSISDGPPKIIAIVLMTIHVIMASPILVTSFSLDCEELADISVERFGKWGEFIIRACFRLVIMTFVGVIACVVPNFGALMSLIGAFSNCLLIFVFPVLFYFRLTGFRNKPFYELAWCFLIILLGVVGLIFGSWSAIDELKVAYTH